MNHEEINNENKRKGLMYSIGIHVVIILLALLPWFKFQDPPPEKEGILISFGAPDMGQGNSKPKTQNKEVVPPKPPAEKEKIEEAKEKPAKPEPSTPKNTTPKKVVTSEKSDAPKIDVEKERRKKLEQERQEQERAKEEAERKAEAEAEAKRKAEAEAEAKRKADYDKAKSQYGDLFGGSGKGKTNTPGNQGDPNGDPNAKNLEGISTGSGSVVGGLGGRKILYEPHVTDNSQKSGKVVIKVCVDNSGKVISADFTQLGSTTTDSELIKIAKTASLKYKFSSSNIPKQYGTITYEFKLK